MRWRALTRDHESGAAMSRLMATWRCRVRSAPWLRRAARPRHRQPCGFHRRAGHESGPKARHEKTRKNPFALQQLIATTDFVCFRVPRRWLSCLGALPEADRLARRNDAWRRPKAYKPVRRDTAHKTRSVVRQRAECSWSRVSAKRNCRHMWNRICGIATMLICCALAHNNLGAPATLSYLRSRLTGTGEYWYNYAARRN